MRPFRTTLSALALAGMLAGTALAADDNKTSGNSNAAASGGQSGQSSGQPQQSQAKSGQGGSQSDQQAPEGFILVDERVVVLTANEPQSHFLRAAQYLQANDSRAAAAEVRIAAAYLDMQASRKGAGQSNVNGQGIPSLKSAADQLRQTADQVASSNQGQRQGQGQTQHQGQAQGQQAQGQQSSQLTQAFAQANLALAHHFQSEASREAQGQKAVMAGHDLDAATAALQAAIAWSGGNPQQEATSAIADAQRLSMQLLSPGGSSATASAQGQDRTADHAAGSTGQGNTNSTDQAQPAGAKISGQQSSGTQGQASGDQARVPQDASKVIDQLGSAIQQCAKQVGHGGDNAAQPGKSTSGNVGGSNSSKGDANK